jgi:hypothetical protein
VPNLIDLPAACRFAPRCATRVDESVANSTEVHPDLLPVSQHHDVRCWLYHDLEGGIIRSEAPPSFRPGASKLAGSVVTDERGGLEELGGTGRAPSTP